KSGPCGHLLGTGLRAVDPFVHALEDLLHLFIEFRAVRNDKHARVRYVLSYPFRQPYHRQAHARTLRMPNDAAFATPHEILSRLRAEVLVVAAQFLGPGVENDKVVDYF